MNSLTYEEMTNRLTNVLSGMLIRSFRLEEVGTLILYFGRDLNVPLEERGTRLWIESAWRLCACGRVIAGSLDKPEAVLPRLQVLKGMRMESVRLDAVGGDITLKLQDSLVISSFSHSVEFEQWQLRREDGLRLGMRENLELYEDSERPD